MNDMLALSVQVQCRIHQGDCPSDAEISIFAPQFVQRPVNSRPALGFLHLWKKGELLHFLHRGETAGLYLKTAHRLSSRVMSPEQVHSGLPDVQRSAGSPGEPCLSGVMDQLAVPDAQRHRGTGTVLLP